MDEAPNTPLPGGYDQGDVHNKLGLLTRQLHDSLRELGYADRLQGSVDALPDAQSRLTYIARLTGEAAEKVLGIVDTAKDEHSQIVEQTQKMREALVADPVAAVAKGHVMNHLEAMDAANARLDSRLTEIMMAQDFHDLTGQVIAKVVKLTSSLEEQLVELLLQTAPMHSAPAAAAVLATAPEVAPAAPAAEFTADGHPALQGPVVDPDNTPNVVTSQSEVDDLLASLGF
ncbi:protein phosphatase CheZ [Comamonas terrigena]|uniref:protein phosphatase CheZ n=1 Tax=Comamonas terrigena TaxID=32013 RepID=UPI002446E1FC|nr:protein phosphatase CheZ [Comamonas terrigena]MDH0050799.1 protein phosphatase CheZ [Comamonas terrigena]MDH0513201.1 protein phosphatase CheZ [Comamonas terrigena]MDH1093134.1 protein phosphatase CheZ [Comamonas terrigena]MDH1292266.1 protein phosphatase CheZ [Comamonas terrigena]MDH1500612.1 protein phosphatase CheZ [Comamonas terrigena]